MPPGAALCALCDLCDPQRRSAPSVCYVSRYGPQITIRMLAHNNQKWYHTSIPYHLCGKGEPTLPPVKIRPARLIGGRCQPCCRHMHCLIICAVPYSKCVPNNGMSYVVCKLCKQWLMLAMKAAHLTFGVGCRLVQQREHEREAEWQHWL